MAQHKYLQILFEKSPHLIGQKFQYSKVDPDIRARELKIALQQLCWAGLLNRIYFSSSSGIPLKSQKKPDRFKLLFLDVGLLQCAMEMDYEEGCRQNILQINSGSVAEQFVGQELLVYGDFFHKKDLFYWEREKKGATAEVDYVIQQGPLIIPIEVKAGITGRLKSLQQFIMEKESRIGIRISQLPLSLEQNILSVPFYLIGQLHRLIKESIQNDQ
jgi:predicted AAA+ superfamily ATPase